MAHVRIDPRDGEIYTRKQFVDKYRGQYASWRNREYWYTVCQPVTASAQEGERGQWTREEWDEWYKGLGRLVVGTELARVVGGPFAFPLHRGREG